MRKSFFFLLLLTVALGISGCQDDGLPEGQAAGTGAAMTVYTHIKLAMPGEGFNTRATTFVNGEEFEDGTYAENEIANLMILFYEKNGGLPVGIYDDKEWTQEADGNENDDIESHVGWNEAEVVPVKMLRAGEPYYAVAFLNYDEDWAAELQNTALNKVPEVVKGDYAVSLQGEKRFLMTNSGYFDGEGNYQFATAIKDFVFPTPEEAKNGNAITIYVERAAVRIDFKIAADAIPTYEVYYGDDAYTLKFTPGTWGLTATEQENFLIKNMKDNVSAYGTEEYPSGFSDWINFNRHRTFWAETPKYGSYVYPGSGVDEEIANYALRYAEYGDLTTEVSSENFSSLYTFEHTFPAADLKTATNPYAVPTSVVFGATYVATGADETVLPFNGKGFYLRNVAERKQMYLEQNASGENDLLETLLKEQTVIYTYSGGQFAAVADADVFEVVNTRIFYANVNDGKGTPSSNTYTLQLKPSLAGGEYYLRIYVPAAGEVGAHYEYKKIDDGATGDEDAATLKEANVALQKNVGTATFYDGARAYFYVPVLHYIAEHDAYKTEEGKYEYTGDFAYTAGGSIENRTGEFGIVRNHIYRLTIDQIEGLGYGQPGTSDGEVDEPDPRPLPDPDEEKQYYFHAKLQILSWHVIDFNFTLK